MYVGSMAASGLAVSKVVQTLRKVLLVWGESSALLMERREDVSSRTAGGSGNSECIVIYITTLSCAQWQAVQNDNMVVVCVLFTTQGRETNDARKDHAQTLPRSGGIALHIQGSPTNVSSSIANNRGVPINKLPVVKGTARVIGQTGRCARLIIVTSTQLHLDVV